MPTMPTSREAMIQSLPSDPLRSFVSTRFQNVLLPDAVEFAAPVPAAWMAISFKLDYHPSRDIYDPWLPKGFLTFKPFLINHKPSHYIMTEFSENYLGTAGL